VTFYAHYFQLIVTVEVTKGPKPAPEVYEMPVQKVGKEEVVDKILLGRGMWRTLPRKSG
jgi:beta-phosphoglucomutase-like phosphatase (HAD superfamily)